jgi:hypothetical protein
MQVFFILWPMRKDRLLSYLLVGHFFPNCLKILELGFAAKYYFSNFAVLKKGPSA